MSEPGIVRCSCREWVRMVRFDTFELRMINPKPDPNGTVVQLDVGYFHIMQGTKYPAEAVRYSLHTCTGGR